MKTILTGLFSLATFIAVEAQPVISSFSPAKGAIGTLVSITGTGFSNTPTANIVYFGAVKATVVSASSTVLSVLVPAGTTYQPLTVVTNGLSAYSNFPFTVTFPGGGTAFTASSFPVRKEYHSGVGTQDVLAADINADGKPDIMACGAEFNAIAAVSCYENVSGLNNPLLANPVPFPTQNASAAINCTDFDGDGLLDIVSAGGAATAVSVLRNTSSGGTVSFADHVDLAAPGVAYLNTCAVAGDFDLDGKPDLAVVYAGIGYVAVFKNNSTPGNIAFSFYDHYDSEGGSEYAETGDIDADGKPEIVICSFNSGVLSVLRNTSTGGIISFAPRIDFLSGPSGNGVSLADIDEDGKLDMVVSQYRYGYGSGNQTDDRINIFRNVSTPGTISFAPKVEYAVGRNPFDPAIADIDGDGKPDIAVCTSGSGSIPYNRLTLFRNSSTPGSISFEPGFEYPTLSNPWGCCVSDLDLDGKPEIIITNFNKDSLSVFSNSIGSALPLSLLGFSATRHGIENHLEWVTNNELNVSHFMAEHSFDGRQFTTTGYIAALGESRNEQHYSFVHRISGGNKMYYRLKMVDNNGNFSYSPVRLIKMGNVTGANIFPNPAVNILYVKGESIQQVCLFDAAGRKLLEKNTGLTGTIMLDISALPKGYCWIKVMYSDHKTSTEKVLIK